MDVEYNICDVCGEPGELERTYYYYNIRCDCHSPEHFEIVSTCPNCTPEPPLKITVEMSPTSYRGEAHNYQIPLRSIHPEHWDYYD